MHHLLRQWRPTAKLLKCLAVAHCTVTAWVLLACKQKLSKFCEKNKNLAYLVHGEHFNILTIFDFVCIFREGDIEKKQFSEFTNKSNEYYQSVK